jgi:hypothetical protein
MEDAILQWLVEPPDMPYVPLDIFDKVERWAAFPVYVPYYLFEGRYSVQWTAERLHEREVTHEDADGQVRADIQTDWKAESGEFEDQYVVLSYASKRHAQLEDELKFFEKDAPHRLEEPDRSHIETSIVEPHDILPDGIFRGQIVPQIEGVARKEAEGRLPGDRYRHVDITEQVFSDNVKHTFLPYWFAYYWYKRKRYRVVLDGQDISRIYGDPPKDEGLKKTAGAQTNPLYWIGLVLTGIMAIALIATLILSLTGVDDGFLGPVVAFVLLVISGFLMWAGKTAAEGKLHAKWKQIRQTSLESLRQDGKQVFQTEAQ